MSTTSEQALPKSVSGSHAMIPKLGKLAYAAVLLSAVVLALTGIGTFVLGQAPMTGWVLMLHVAVTGLFALGLAVMALTWAGHAGIDGDASLSGLAKAWFWLILLSGLVVIVSGVVPMTPLFGTEGQHQLYLIHRYSGIVVAVALVLHALSWKRKKS